MANPSFLISFTLLTFLALPANAGLPPPQLQLLKPSDHLLPTTPPSCSPQRSHIFTPTRERGIGRGGATAILEMRHRDYCSNPKPNTEERAKKLLSRDEARVRSLQRTQLHYDSNDQSEARIPLASGIKLQTLNYVVAVGVGGKKTTLIMDTGSDLTWVQCKPCNHCYKQQGPLYDPSTSPTYHPFPCNSTTCRSLQLITGNPEPNCSPRRPNCGYSLSYGDGSYTRGELARDVLNLAGTNLHGFVFGCGRSNHGLFGGVSGLMGLGRSEISLVSQTAAEFGGVFSYCLPSKDRGSSGTLVLGGHHAAYRNATPISFTKIVSTHGELPYYLLNLTGMSLGGVEIMSPGLISSGAKFIIDSGTVVTRLPPSVYSALTAEFSKQFTACPPAPSFSILGTCFNFSGHREVEIPTLSFQFEGGAAVVDVDVAGMLYFVGEDTSQACLAVASLTYETQLGIIGNYQQKNLRVIYDTSASRVGFARETCSYD